MDTVILRVTSNGTIGTSFPLLSPRGVMQDNGEIKSRLGEIYKSVQNSYIPFFHYQNRTL
jgi:hypothetical protein